MVFVVILDHRGLRGQLELIAQYLDHQGLQVNREILDHRELPEHREQIAQFLVRRDLKGNAENAENMENLDRKDPRGPQELHVFLQILNHQLLILQTRLLIYKLR